MIYMTYLKLKQRLKNVYEMTVEKVMKKERRLEFVEASREDSFLNLVPSEALENDLQKLSTHKHMA
jgi:plasmid maintenance system killer protein